MGKNKKPPNLQAPNRKESPALQAPRKKGGVKPSSSVLSGGDTSDQRISWRFGKADFDGRWGFAKVKAEQWPEIMAKVAHCESMTVTELRASRDLFKTYDLPSSIIAEAADRLAELNLDDLTQIHRIRFTGKQRLYGLLRENIFYVIWWDPLHEICPSKLKNT
jgi:hypothetical protein